MVCFLSISETHESKPFLKICWIKEMINAIFLKKNKHKKGYNIASMPVLTLSSVCVSLLYKQQGP